MVFAFAHVRPSPGRRQQKLCPQSPCQCSPIQRPSFARCLKAQLAANTVHCPLQDSWHKVLVKCTGSRGKYNIGSVVLARR